jgi:phosphoglycolate phosphatase-like HAD superfamily hydrolase
VLKAVLWDFDGTICDTYPAIARAVNAALATFGASASLERIIALASVSLDRCIRTLAEDHAIPYAQLDAAFSVAYQQVRPIDQPPFPGVGDLCRDLAQAGVLNFIVTHRRRASLQILLDTHELRSYFTAIVAADDGFPRKPAPDAILQLLRIYHIAPGEALLIGDRDLDICAGQAAGVPTCLFGTLVPDLSPTRTIATFAELADIIPNTPSL